VPPHADFAARLPLPIPAPVRVGVPGRAYPWPWSVCPWFGGEVAAESTLNDAHREAERLGSFVAAMHVPAPSDAPTNPYRGFPVAELTERVAANVAVLGHERGGDVLGRWSDLVEAPPWGGPPLWIHGDLHTANLLVDGGAISAVIDFGDITAADPAVDLAIAWMLFGSAERAVFRSSAGSGEFPVDQAMWARAEAWALHFAVLYLLNSADNPRFARMGEQLLTSILDDSI
jgi:aminoglycoside phosphotransferase (APT) family kinase protein